MTTDEAVERVKVICAPPGSILIFGMPKDAYAQDVEAARKILTERLPEYRVFVTYQPIDIQAIVPESPPPVVNNYVYTPANTTKEDYEAMAALAYHTPDRTMEGQS